MLAALPAVVMGIVWYGFPALGVVSLSVSCAMVWELLLNKAMGRAETIGDGNAAVIGLLLAMLLPATAPWWLVVIGTFLAIVVGKQIYGGMGCNPFNPVLVAFAIVVLSWRSMVDFDGALLNYDLGFSMLYPLGAVKHFGASAALDYRYSDLLMGMQSGGIGATFGLGLIVGGCYLILRGMIRWEISISFIVGILVTAHLFHMSDPEEYAGAWFHLLTGYTLLGAFFLAPEDSSSPVNVVPMLIYGLCGGVLTILIRSIGAFSDGVVFAILMMNVANPLLDKIRPKAVGRGIEHA
jgi:electron transport complex protein RnfD